MNALDDLDYYSRRERQERLMAKQAPDSAIAAIHLDLARRYAALASRAVRQAPRSGVKLRIVTEGIS